MKRISYNKLIILDWDDTLFPTTWVLKNSIDLNNSDHQNKYIVFFSKLDLLLHKLLTNLLKHGKVVIVTNAMKKWVYISATILPNTKQLINNNIDVISARDKWQRYHPSDGYMWKKLIFEELVMEYFLNADNTHHIISVGDAYYEFNALVNLDNKNYRRYLKAIKLLSAPSYDVLIDQLEVFHKSVKKIMETKNHMDLQFDDK